MIPGFTILKSILDRFLYLYCYKRNIKAPRSETRAVEEAAQLIRVTLIKKQFFLLKSRIC